LSTAENAEDAEKKRDKGKIGIEKWDRDMALGE
jgi:hypothetical protein